ncbi:MAG: phospholipid carrier-dependent glycosyltransferase [Anaerolineales bacterium]|nr:phospholipid carrier-dependent glycosyltransferase [Anaerolineales bacterium]
MSHHRLGLLVIILIALALRLTLLGEQSLWYDEGVTWLLSQKPPGELLQWTAADIQPPLYYLLMWETDALFGSREWALRFPSVIFGVLTVPLLYILARRLFPASRQRLTSPPLLAAALLAISPVMVYYAQEARMYTLLVFEVTLAGYLLLKFLHPKPSTFNNLSSTFNLQPSTFPYILTAAAALYTHYFAAFLLIAHGLYGLFIWWQRGWPRRLAGQLLQIFRLDCPAFCALAVDFAGSPGRRPQLLARRAQTPRGAAPGFNHLHRRRNRTGTNRPLDRSRLPPAAHSLHLIRTFQRSNVSRITHHASRIISFPAPLALPAGRPHPVIILPITQIQPALHPARLAGFCFTGCRRAGPVSD